MIHLVTSAPALQDVIEWLALDDILIVAGGALNAAHGLQGLPCRAATFTDDKALFPSLEIDAITTEEWLDLLEESPCRTWS
jgi:hypothetical protein